MTAKPARVVFYALGRKFIQEKKNEQKPESKTQQLVYYTLAVGHHIGVIDCLDEKLSVPYSDYQTWIAKLPEGEKARSKFEGLLKFGEITIDHSHIHPLALALDGAKANMNEAEKSWSNQLITLLGHIEAEPAMYLMVRRQDG